VRTIAHELAHCIIYDFCPGEDSHGIKHAFLTHSLNQFLLKQKEIKELEKA